MRLVNEGLAFVLELAALAALAYWGFTAEGVAAKIVLGVGAPVVAAVVWGLFAAPRATVALPLPGVLLVKAIVFGAAVAALAVRGDAVPAIVFAVLVVANTAYVTVVRRPRYPGPSAVELAPVPRESR